MFSYLSPRKNIDSLVAAAAGACIIFLFTRHSGIGLCPDGVVYTTAAENIVRHGRFADFTQGPVIDFPVFYSLFLGIGVWLTGVPLMVFSPFLNAFLLGCVIYLAGALMERFQSKSKMYKAAVLACIVFSPGLLEVYSMMWSETIFILLLLLFINAMFSYLQSSSRNALACAALIASIACITRYAGVTLVGAGSILILLNSQLNFKKKCFHELIFTLISISLLAINLYRNHVLSGTLTGNREQSLTSLAENMRDAGSVFIGWLAFIHADLNASFFIVVLLIALLLVVIMRHLFFSQRPAIEHVATVFALFYLLFMIGTATISRFETLNSRFMAPIYILLLWSCTYWLVPLLVRNKFLITKWATCVFTIFLLASFEKKQFEADAETWDGVKDAGIPGYTEDQWTKSATVGFIKKDELRFKKNYTIYSDAYDAVYWFTGRPGKFLPAREYAPGVKDFLNDRHCYLVWFNDGENDDLVDLHFITSVKKMKLVRKFDDGAVYEYGN